MGRLYVNQTLEKQIRQYCEWNEIEDINAFANRCLMQGFNIVKFGISPSDNKERENKGIKDIKKNENRTKKKDPSTEDEGKQKKSEDSRKEEPKENSKPTEERKEPEVKVRKIQIIKKG